MVNEAITEEKLSPNLRARGKENSQVSQYVAQVIKKAAKIADIMNPKLPKLISTSSAIQRG